MMEDALNRMFFKAFTNETRQDIIYLLKNGPLTVTEIGKKLNYEQSRVSHSLRFLEVNGFVVSWKFGKWIKYSLDKEFILPILNLSEKHVKKYRKQLSNKMENLKQILKKHNLALPEIHTCKCEQCSKLPESVITFSSLDEKHTCQCKACIENCNQLIDTKTITILQEDHTCNCDACLRNQKTLSVLN